MIDQYVFAVIVSKEGRQDVMVQQEITVVRAEPPHLDIRCVRNCKEKINSQKPLALAVDCSNCRNGTVIRYQWSIMDGDGVKIHDDPFLQDFIIGQDSRYLIIEAAIFSNLSSQLISVSVRGKWDHSKAYGLARDEFIIGGIPLMGSCNIVPEVGIALETEFTIECSDFYSEELPLHYEFLYSTGQPSVASISSRSGRSRKEDTSTYILLFHSPEGTSPMITLPMGPSDRNHMLDIRVVVTDAIGAQLQFDTFVQVFSPDRAAIEFEVSSLREDINATDTVSTLDLLLGKGDIQAATRLMTTIATVLNEDEEEAEEEDGSLASDYSGSGVTHADYKSEVRSLLVQKLSEIPVHSLDSTKQKCAAITQVLLKPTELDQSTQQTAADTYLEMLDIIDEEANEGTDSDTIQDVSVNLFSGAFNLLEAASGKASGFYQELQSDSKAWDNFWTTKEEALNEIDVPQDVPTSMGLVSDADEDVNVPDMDELENEPWVPEQLRMSRNVTKKVFQIIDRISNTLVRNKLPGEPAMVVQTDKLSLILKKEDLEETSVRFYSADDGAWFKVPQEAIESVKEFTNEDSVISQLFSSPENPFSWHLSAYEVKTSVIGLYLKDSRGNPLLVSDLSSDIELLIPHTDTYYSVQDLGTSDVGSKDFTFFHFNLSDSHTSIHIDITPTDGSSKQLEAWLRFGFWPTEKLFDRKVSLPHPHHKLYSSVYNSTKNITTNPYTWFIAENELFATGSYYIGVKVKVAEIDTSFISEGMNITIPEEIVNVNVKIYTARCLYWSDAYEQWFPYGCQVGTLTTAYFTHCLCNHLTSFGGSFLVPPKKQLFEDDEVIIIPELQETMLVMYVVAGAGGFMLVCLFFGFICDYRHRKKIFGGIKVTRNCYIVKVFTAMEYHASTTAKVSIVLHGADSSSKPLRLFNEDNLSLRSGCIDTYMVATKKALGKLTGISFFHDGGGFSPTWHVSRILIEEFSSGTRYHFLCNIRIKKPFTQYTFQTASRQLLAGWKHLFDTSGTSERFGKLVPLWYLMRRPFFGWLTSAECIVTLFAGIFASMLGVVALKEYIFPVPISMPEEPTWMIEMDEVMTGVQAMVLALPLQYLLLAIFSSIQRKLPSRPKETDGDDLEVTVRNDVKTEGSVKEVSTEKSKLKKSDKTKPKKQASLQEIRVEVPEVSATNKEVSIEKSELDISNETKPKKQASLQEIRVEVPEESPKDKHRKVGFSDSNPKISIPDDTDTASDIPNEDHQLEKLNDHMLAIPHAIRTLGRRSRHLTKHSIRNVLDDSASVDSFASVVSAPPGESPESDDSDFGSLTSITSVEDVGNINQNASSLNNVKEAADVDGKSRYRNGPARWSKQRHRKQNPELLMYKGGNSTQMKNEKSNNSTRKPTAINSLPLKDQKQRNNNAIKREKLLKQSPMKNATKVETLGSTNESHQHSDTMLRYPETSKASCCTIVIEYLVQFLSKTCLPSCCVFLFWPIILLLFGGSGFMIIYLTQSYHEGLVRKWILASAVAITVSNLLVQPLLGILISIFNCICQKPGNLSTTSLRFEMQYKFKLTRTQVDKELKSDKSKSKLLQRQNLQTSPVDRTRLVSRLKVLMQVIFTAVTLYVVYSRHDPNVFYWNQTVKDMFVSGKSTGTRDLNKVHTSDQFWDWSNHTLLPSLSAILDSHPYYEHLVLLQMPRLRQFRVQQTLPEKCPKVNIFQHWISNSDSCQTMFSIDDQDTRFYSEGWQPLPHGSEFIPNGYRYFTAEELDGVPYNGLYASYPGGGYMAQLGRTSQSLQDSINVLSNDKWVHANTKAVILEFIIFNTQVNLTSIVQIALEMLPTSVADVDIQILTVVDLNVYGIIWWIQVSVKGLFCLIAAIKIGLGTASILEHGREYFSTFPHQLNLLDVILSGAGAAFIVLEFLTTDSASSISSSYVELSQVYFLQYLTSSILAGVVFISSVNVLLFLRVFKTFEIPINILQRVWYETCSTSPMYVAAIMTFAYPGWFLFSAVTSYFNTIWKAIQSLNNLLLGGLYWDTTDPAMPYFIMCYLVVFNFVKLFAFCAVIIQTYKLAKVQETLDQFINFQILSKLALKIRHRIVTKRFLRSVRLRKAIIAWGWRRGRNDEEPVSYDANMRQVQDRAQMLVHRIQGENDVLFNDVNELVSITQKTVQNLYGK